MGQEALKERLQFYRALALLHLVNGDGEGGLTDVSWPAGDRFTRSQMPAHPRSAPASGWAAPPAFVAHIIVAPPRWGVRTHLGQAPHF